MMRRPERTVQETANDSYSTTYYEAVGHLNRKDRRTASGRLKVAKAQSAALQAKVRVLEQELQSKEGGAA